jgi:hypothetical protein
MSGTVGAPELAVWSSGLGSPCERVLPRRLTSMSPRFYRTRGL